jgi:hypothetical protein
LALAVAETKCPRSKSDLLDALVALNKHTLVAYPVGYHIDVFADKEPSLENRICFVYTNRCQAGSGPALGRGGAGAGKFCWALLDWPQKRANRRNVKRVKYNA